MMRECVCGRCFHIIMLPSLGMLRLWTGFLTEGGVSVDATDYVGYIALHYVCWRDFLGMDEENILTSLRYCVEECGALI